MIASVSSLGSVHIWSTAMADTWSAFAPGFEELEENHIYEEKEDEFDLVSLRHSLRRILLPPFVANHLLLRFLYFKPTGRRVVPPASKAT